MARCTELAALLDATLLGARRASSTSRHAMILMADVPGAAALYRREPRLSGIRCRLRNPVRSRRDRRRGARAHADPHQAHDDRIRLRPRHPRKRAGQRTRRPAGDRDPAARPARAAQPARRADRRRRRASPACSTSRARGTTRFGYDDEDALAAIATQLGLAMQHLQAAEAQDESPRAPERTVPANGTADRRAALRERTTACSSATTT